MPSSPISITVNHSGVPRYLSVLPRYHSDLFCSYTITDADGYLFTLIPTDCPSTDFRLSDADIELDHPIEWTLVDEVKATIINHFM
jgi:hypothetical protein